MGVANFIPQLWSARLLAHLDEEHVLTNLVNRDYEGEIKAYGDTVKITNIGNISVKDYISNADISDPEELTTDQRLLTIDQQKYFNFQIDDVDKAQIRAGLMDEAMKRSAYALSQTVDKWLAELMVKGAAEGTTIGTDDAPIAVNKDTVYQYIVQMKVMMDRQNIPTQGRWLLVPPECHGLLLSDNRFVGTGGSQAEGTLTNGHVGKVAGFNIYLSNNLPNTLGKYKLIASYNGSTSFAEQVLQTEAYRMEKRFADAVKGLHVYGAKVLRSDKIIVLTAAFDCGILQPITLNVAAGSAAGKVKITAIPEVASGYSAKVKTAASVALPQYDAICTTGWAAFTGDAEIDVAEGNEVVVAFVDSKNMAKAAGKTTVKLA